MNNKNKNEETQLTNIPDWIKGIEAELGVSSTEILSKQAASTELIPEGIRSNSVASITKLAEVSKGYYTENELIFMYVVGVGNIISLTEELKQTKTMLRFFSGMSSGSQDATIEEVK